MDANKTASIIEKSVRSMAAEVSTAATVRSEFTRSVGELWSIEMHELSGFRALNERSLAEGKMHGELLVKSYLSALERAGLSAASIDATLKKAPQVLVDAFLEQERRAGHLYTWSKRVQTLEKNEQAKLVNERPLVNIDPRLQAGEKEADIMRRLDAELQSINDRPSTGRHYPQKKGRK